MILLLFLALFAASSNNLQSMYVSYSGFSDEEVRIPKPRMIRDSMLVRRLPIYLGAAGVLGVGGLVALASVNQGGSPGQLFLVSGFSLLAAAYFAKKGMKDVDKKAFLSRTKKLSSGSDKTFEGNWNKFNVSEGKNFLENKEGIGWVVIGGQEAAFVNRLFSILEESSDIKIFCYKNPPASDLYIVLIQRSESQEEYISFYKDSFSPTGLIIALGVLRRIWLSPEFEKEVFEVTVKNPLRLDLGGLAEGEINKVTNSFYQKIILQDNEDLSNALSKEDANGFGFQLGKINKRGVGSNELKSRKIDLYNKALALLVSVIRPEGNCGLWGCWRTDDEVLRKDHRLKLLNIFYSARNLNKGSLVNWLKKHF